MSFEALLRRVLADCEEARGVAFMGTDGVPIEEAVPSAAEQLGGDVGAVGVEFGRILCETRKAADAVDGGAVDELAVRLAGFWVLVRVVDDESFLMLTLGPEANVGKARFVLRRELASLRAEL